MALNIKNARVERLAQQVAAATGETKTEAIRRALEERMQRLNQRASLLKFLRREVWPTLPNRRVGKAVTKKGRAAILGFGPRGF